MQITSTNEAVSDCFIMSLFSDGENDKKSTSTDGSSTNTTSST